MFAKKVVSFLCFLISFLSLVLVVEGAPRLDTGKVLKTFKSVLDALNITLSLSNYSAWQWWDDALH